MAAVILEVKNASFGYEKNKRIIDSLSLTARSGELVAILGPNGAGKTTLLRCIMGFLRWNEGNTLLDGKDVRSISQNEFWRRVSYVPQAKGTAVGYTAEEMILLGLTGNMGIFSTPREKEYKKLRSIAEQLSITHLLKKRCNEMSGGELQMVLIARAVISEPELLILDEPESNLDFKNQLIVLDTLTTLASKGVCCIFNTHYPTHALMRASSSLILRNDGSSIFGETSQVVTKENIREYFGVETVISEIETQSNTYRSILPVGLSDETGDPNKKQDAIAVITAVFSDFSLAGKINTILHEYSEYLLGRFGLPQRDEGFYMINATLDAPLSVSQGLSHRLSVLRGVNVKTVYVEKRGEANEQ